MLTASCEPLFCEHSEKPVGPSALQMYLIHFEFFAGPFAISLIILQLP